MRNKKANAPAFFLIVAAVIVALIVGVPASMYVIDKVKEFRADADGQALSIASADQVALADIDTSKCPTDGITTVNVQIYDDFGSTPTTPLADSIVYAENIDTGIIEVNTTTVSTGYATMNVACGARYKLHSITKAGATGSATISIVTDEDKEFVDLHTNKLSMMEIRMKDLVGDDWEFAFANGTTSGLNYSTITDVNSTNFYDDTAATAFAIGSGGSLDLLINLRAKSNDEYANDKGIDGDMDTKVSLGLKHYMCVDLGGATNGQEWDSDKMKVTVDAVKKTDVKNEIDDDSLDHIFLQTSEKCYDIGDIDDVNTPIGLYIEAKTSNDPDNTDDDVTIYFLQEGTYKSSDVAHTIKTGIFTDASTQGTVSYTTQIPKVVLKIS